MTTLHEVEAARVAPETVQSLRQFAGTLPESEMRDLIFGLASSVDAGVDVTLLDSGAELTPSQVAARLRMSRTHLYKLLDDGAIPSHRVGRDRRIRFSDIAAFEQQRQHDRRELAERFAHSSETRAGAINEIADTL